MSQSPAVLVWHAQAEAYRDALRRRLPGTAIEVVAAADHDSGEAGAVEVAHRCEALLAWKVPAGALSQFDLRDELDSVA